MRFLFVSPEQVVRQKYRRGIVFRLSAVCVFLGLAAQIPVFVSGVLAWKSFTAESGRQKTLLVEAGDLRKQSAPLEEIRQELSQIRRWEPILRSRVPVSALLGALEKSVPANAALDSISIESAQYDEAPVCGGVFRIPTSYRVVIQGLERAGVEDAVQSFRGALQRRLPPGTELARSERLPTRPDNLKPFVLEYSIKPTGNYFGLGLQKIAEPDSL